MSAKKNSVEVPTITMKTTTLCAVILTFLSIVTARDGAAEPAEGHRYKAVYLDPYYGGRKSGPAIDKKNKGKDVTLSLARAMHLKLQASQITTFLSRDEDIEIPSGDRWFYAKKKGADIYLSLRLRPQTRDCVQISYAWRQPKPRISRKEESMITALKDEVVVQESRRLSEFLIKSLGSESIAMCGPARVQKDVLFETADFPAVIMEFNVARSVRKKSYVVDPVKVERISKATTSAIKEFMAAQPQ